jgi:hypothetical protein
LTADLEEMSRITTYGAEMRMENGKKVLFFLLFPFLVGKQKMYLQKFNIDHHI